MEKDSFLKRLGRSKWGRTGLTLSMFGASLAGACGEKAEPTATPPAVSTPTPETLIPTATLVPEPTPTPEIKPEAFYDLLLSKLADPWGPKGKFILTTRLNQGFEGEFVGKTGNSWTIKKGEETLTITHDKPEVPVWYYIREESGTIGPQSEADVKPGELITIGSSVGFSEQTNSVEWISSVIYINRRAVVSKPLPFKLSSAPNPQSIPEPSDNLEKLINALVNPLGPKGEFVNYTDVLQQFYGKLVAIEDNSWTLEVAGERLTVINEMPEYPTEYVVNINQQYQKATKEEIHIGDTISLGARTMLEEGKLVVVGVTADRY